MSEQIRPQSSDVVAVAKRKVVCDGPETGRHPRVFLEMNDGEKTVVCPYCSRVFQFAPNEVKKAAHS